MPRWCGTCRFVTDDLFANACPQCQTPLRLSPHGSGTTPRYRPSSGRGWLIAGAVLLAVAVPVAYFALPAGVNPAARRSAGGVEVGMSMNEAAWVIQPAPPTRRGEEHLSHTFPADCLDSGTLFWEGRGKSVTVRFRRGVVTEVEEDVSRNRGGGTWDVKYDPPEGAP